MRKMVGGDLLACSGYIHWYRSWLQTFGEIHEIYIEHTPAGGSPPRPVPKFDDVVEVVQLPYGHNAKLKIGHRGRVVSTKGARYLVRFAGGWMEWFTAVQIDLVR